LFGEFFGQDLEDMEGRSDHIGQMAENEEFSQEHIQPATTNTTPLTPSQEHELAKFWEKMMEDVQQANQFKNHPLPIARIKKIMKSDEDVRVSVANHVKRGY
jgi:hypothetical protein